LNISVKSDYALHAVFDLAVHATREPVKIADIARRQNIPQKFLELILSNLKQGGFVESRRGADGGYRLARPPGSITVGELLRYVEGRQHERNRPRHKSDSPFAELWKQVDDSAAAVLENTTFEALAQRWAESHSRFVPNWEI
jgi:Rrf2 family cysteine metabolism transcriptional repressor